MAREKYKGSRSHAETVDRKGLGRLRRSAEKPVGRESNWAGRHEDDVFVESHGHIERASHTGERLIARFNRLAGAGMHAQAEGIPGEISGTEGTGLLVRTAAGEFPASVRRSLTKRIGGVRNPLAVGDRVRVLPPGDDPDVPATAGVVTAVEPRRNQLERVDSHNRSLVHVIAANLDLLLVTAAVATPEPRAGLIDRYLLLAAWCGIPAVLVLTKCDLAPAATVAELSAVWHGVVPVHTLALVGEDPGLAALRTFLHGKSCVICGQSGVGKSTLVNALFPGTGARIGGIADAGHGRHTTVSARSYLLPGDGRLIDTPGVRECGVAGLTPVDVALHYPDLARHQPLCRFADCTHRHEPDCAVLAARDRGEIAASRYASYRSIVDEDLLVR